MNVTDIIDFSKLSLLRSSWLHAVIVEIKYVTVDYRSSYSVHSVQLTLTKNYATLAPEIISQIYYCGDTLIISSILNTPPNLDIDQYCDYSTIRI